VNNVVEQTKPFIISCSGTCDAASVVSLNALPNNSFQPTLASESFIIKLRGFGYVVCSALASVG
jgi:hypothetical protein